MPQCLEQLDAWQVKKSGLDADLLIQSAAVVLQAAVVLG
jgi:hypothetical protein